MNLCSSGHEEVCYESEPCPCCEAITKINELEEEIDDLKSEASDA